MNTVISIAQRIIDKPGILAVRVQRLSNASDHRVVVSPDAVAHEDEVKRNGSTKLCELVLVEALRLYAIYGNTGSLRLVRGDNGPDCVTTGCFCEGDIVVAVMLSTGHPISKSLRRLVARAIAANLSTQAA